MKIPFSSENPDAVQKVLNLTGGAGEIEKAALGMLLCALATWGLFKLLKKTGGGKP